MQYGCYQILLSPTPELKAILEFICEESNKLTNCGIYLARQLWFKSRKYIKKFDLIKEYKNNPHYQVLYSQVAQQTLLTVQESFKSFYELDKKYRKNELDFKPKLPSYRKKGGLTFATYPKQALKLVKGGIEFSMGNTVHRWFGLKSFFIPIGCRLYFDDIKEIRIIPRNQCFYLDIVYEKKPPTINYNLNPAFALGIDTGVDNWLACTSNIGTSFIVDGRKVKSLNQRHNKRIAKLKTDKPQGFWSKQLAQITEKRNRVMRDAVNKAAKIVINHCLTHQIGTLIFGWNKKIKQEINIGKVNNQHFVQIPTARLKNRIQQLCEYYGIKFVETEESYTSQSSFLDNDVLPKRGEKPAGWQSSGKRLKRGLFVTKTGLQVNADTHAAMNIIKKVAAHLNISLEKSGKGLLTVPQRIFLWKNNRKKRF